MSIKRTLFKNTSLNLFSYLYLAIASIISIPILLKSFGTNVFGLYVLLNAVIPLVSVLEFGISSAAIRQMSLPDVDRKDQNKTWRTALTISIVTGIFTAIVSFIFMAIMGRLPSFSVFAPGYLLLVILVQVATIFVDRLSAHMSILPQVRQQFEIYNLRTIIVGSGNTIISAILSIFIPDILIIFLVQLAFYILGLLVLLIYCRRYFAPLPLNPDFDKPVYRKLIGFGIKNFVGKAASQVEAQLSKYLVGGYLSSQAVAIFSIPQSLVIKGAGAVSQLPLALFPLSTSLTSKERIGKLRQLVFVLQSMILVIGVSGIALVYRYGHELLSLWLHNPAVVDMSFPVLKILIWYFALTILTPIPTTICDSINKPQIPSFFAVFTTVIEIILLITFVPVMGVLGAAYAIVGASAVSVSIFMIVFYFVFNRHWRKILPHEPVPYQLQEV